MSQNVIDRILDAAAKADAQVVAVSPNKVPSLWAVGAGTMPVPGFRDEVTGPELYPALREIIPVDSNPLKDGVHRFEYTRSDVTYKVHSPISGDKTTFHRIPA